MKTKFWILLFLAIAVVCAGLSVWLLGGRAETTVEVYSTESLYRRSTLPLTANTALNPAAAGMF